MKINPNGIRALETYKSQASDNIKNCPAKSTNTNTSQTDRIEISKQARDMQIYQKELKTRSGVRENLVASLKAKIESGTYKPSPEKIAEGIIKERLLDEKV